AHAAHLDLAAGDGRDHRPTAGLDVVAPQAVLGAAQHAAALDANRRCTGAGDADAELRQKRAQLDDVWFARGMADLADPGDRGRPTSAPSGSSLTISGQRTRSVVLPMPSTSPLRSRISRAITSTSLIRGTLVRTHSSLVSRHAASSGSAAFLLPSTSTAPVSR